MNSALQRRSDAFLTVDGYECSEVSRVGCIGTKLGIEIDIVNVSDATA